MDRVLPPVDKNGIVSSTTKTTLQQTKKDDSSSNTSEPTTVKRGTQKEKGVSTKTDQKVAPPSIDMQMSDIDTTDTDDDNETNGQKSNHLKNQENTKNIKKGMIFHQIISSNNIHLSICINLIYFFCM